MAMTKLECERLPFSELQIVVQACREAGLSVIVIGGLATGFYLQRYRRYTEDIDLVVPATDVEELLTMLQSCGFDITGTRQWWKASKEMGDHELIVDVVTETIAESATEQSHTLSLSPLPPLAVVTPFSKELGELACEIPAAGPEDLIILKLLSGRDKGLIDLTALLLESFKRIDLTALHEKIATAHLQMTMNLAIAEWRNALRSGELGYLWEATYDRPLTRRQVASLLRKIERLTPE